jgi:hypothetical protein
MSALSLIAIAAALLTAVSTAQSVDELQKNFTTKCDDLNADRDAKLEKLDAGYKVALKTLVDDTQKSGKLDAVLMIRDELTAIETGKTPLPALPANCPPSLRTLRTKYLEQLTKISQDHARELAGLANRMQTLLAGMETSLTKEGRIDDALAAKRLREKLATDTGIKDAQDLLKYSGKKGNARAALQLRRSGDHIEVLVFPDSRGKISMDSPIENLREKSESKKETGDTKAKVLGEFVGATNFNVDPFVSFHQVFDGADPGNFPLNGILAKYRFEIEKQKGVRLSLIPNGVNPYGSFGCNLPLSAKGTYRASARYFVPKSNRALSGFILVHGGGGAIKGKIFEETGKWAFGEVSSESTGDDQSMLFYLAIATGSKPADAVNDHIVLGEIKIEHIKFAAYLRTKFGPAGEVVTTTEDPLKQSLFISNGLFVEP